MRNKLKQFRVAKGMTQTKVAEAVGVTQPNYHRWEAGSAPIPTPKLKLLARVLKTSADAILGRHSPIETTLYDDTASPDLNYYGEVSIHFCGGGAPLLLTISDAAFSQLHRDLQRNTAFVTVESLANQTVALRTSAIADLYFSSEAYDDYGPEHETYEHHADVQIPDARDWEIIESLAVDGIGLEDFDPIDVKRVEKMIMITDAQFEKLVRDGSISAEDIEAERARSQEETKQIFELALTTTYQLSTGQRRSVYVDQPESLFNAFNDLTDFEGGDPDDDMIRIEAEGRHRIVFINKRALDYVSIPTHQYKEGRIEAEADSMDADSK